MIKYRKPQIWISYQPQSILESLTGAKAAILALTEMPFQRSWADQMQEVQLKREVAGTSRIEGAEFTQMELEEALEQTPHELHTRSQRQAAAAAATYRWIAQLPSSRPVDQELILEVHRRLVTGCDDDHCEPGTLRRRGQNVNFGSPQHRGVEGGDEREQAFAELMRAVGRDFSGHDPLVQAHALHYHLAAMHPFLDGNGRIARAMEALLLQRLGLRDALFIAMSNHYYDEKSAYLEALRETGEQEDLTPFLAFALRGVELQCRRLLAEIRKNISKALFRDTMLDLFQRLQSPRKRVMSQRHVRILSLLLEEADPIELGTALERIEPFYEVKNPGKAQTRDLGYLMDLGAIVAFREESDGRVYLSVNLDWPAQITETEFFAKTREMGKAKPHGLRLP